MFKHLWVLKGSSKIFYIYIWVKVGLANLAFAMLTVIIIDSDELTKKQIRHLFYLILI